MAADWPPRVAGLSAHGREAPGAQPMCSGVFASLAAAQRRPAVSTMALAPAAGRAYLVAQNWHSAAASASHQPARGAGPREDAMKFRPLHDRVVVKRIEEEQKTKGGLIIPDIAKEKPM